MPTPTPRTKLLPGVTGSYCPGPQEVTRYTLANGWFIDGCRKGPHRNATRQTYALFEPGGSPEGGAQQRATSNKLADLVQEALRLSPVK